MHASLWEKHIFKTKKYWQANHKVNYGQNTFSKLYLFKAERAIRQKKKMYAQLYENQQQKVAKAFITF